MTYEYDFFSNADLIILFHCNIDISSVNLLIYIIFCTSYIYSQTSLTGDTRKIFVSRPSLRGDTRKIFVSNIRQDRQDRPRRRV